jgi:uncharacterized FlgJ-related protein
MKIIDIGCHIIFGYVQDSVESYFFMSFIHFRDYRGFKEIRFLLNYKAHQVTQITFPGSK